MVDRGLLMEGEFRYLTPASEGQVGGAWLDDAEDERKLQSEYEDQRWMYNWQHKGGLDSRLLAKSTIPTSAIRTTSRTWIPTLGSTGRTSSTSAAA